MVEKLVEDDINLRELLLKLSIDVKELRCEVKQIRELLEPEEKCLPPSKFIRDAIHWNVYYRASRHEIRDFLLLLFSYWPESHSNNFDALKENAVEIYQVIFPGSALHGWRSVRFSIEQMADAHKLQFMSHMKTKMKKKVYATVWTDTGLLETDRNKENLRFKGACTLATVIDLLNANPNIFAAEKKDSAPTSTQEE